MLRTVFCSTGSALHCVLMPVVAASENRQQIYESELKTTPNYKMANDDSGWKRIRIACKPTQYSVISPELASVLSTTTNSLVMGGIIGTFFLSRIQYMNFMRDNQASNYASHLDAKADLSNRMIGGMIKGALAWGFRFAAISFTWSILSNFIPVYRDTTSWVEYLAGGLVSGTLGGYLFRDSPRLGLSDTTTTSRKLLNVKSVVYGALLGSAVGAVVAIGLYKPKEASKSFQERYWQKFWDQQKAKRKREPTGDGDSSNNNGSK